MKINYNLDPVQQANLLKNKFAQCIENHQRTNTTDNLDATTFTDEERIVLNVIEIIVELDGNCIYWSSVSKCIEDD